MAELRQEMNLERRLRIEEMPLGMEQVGGPEHTFVYSVSMDFCNKFNDEKMREIKKDPALLNVFEKDFLTKKL